MAAHTNNMAFLQSWEKQSGKNAQLNDALKKLHETAFAFNAVISLKYVLPSSVNHADSPSCVLSDLDCMLSRNVWQKLEQSFGPHTIDLMSLDSNVQSDSEGEMLRHSLFYTALFRSEYLCSDHFHSRECLRISSICTCWSTSEISAVI